MLVVDSHCSSSDCPFCAAEFFRWYKQRMKQMHHRPKGSQVSFAEAAATSIRPPV